MTRVRIGLSDLSLSGDLSSSDNDEMITASLSPAEDAIAPANAMSAVTVPDGALVEIIAASSQTITFAGTAGTLKLDDAVAFTGKILGLTGSDSLDLVDINYGANTTATFLGNTNGGTLTVTDGNHTANIALVGNYLSSNWDLSSDGHGGTIVVDPVSSNNWQTLDVGAGGYVDGIDIAPDDTMVVRTDTYGAYIWNGTQWQQLVTSASMPSAFVTPNMGQGVYEIQIAPSNSNILYMMYDGYVFKSTNKGATWTETSFTQVTEKSSDNYRMDGQKMAIDPENPNVVYVGTPKNGLFVTTNGGVSWQSVSAVPVSLTDSSGVYPGITGIEFDPALGVTGGNTNTIFAASYGNGVYESTNGGASWSAIGGPSEVGYAAVSSTGVYYVVGNGNSLWRYNNGAWTELLSDTSNGIRTVAVDPFNPNEIVVQSVSGKLNISYNGGVSWSGSDLNNALKAADIPWLAVSGTNYMAIGGTVFDQLVPNKLWASAGVGVWQTDNLLTANFQTNTKVVWNDKSIGIEQLCSNEIVVPPGGNPVLASFDRPFFYISNLNAYPSTYGPVSGQVIGGWSVDYASSDPSFLVGLADYWGTEESGYSTNGGQTWTKFATELPGAGQNFIGGTIAASSPTDIVWAPAGGEDPYYTLNGGLTWNRVTLPGVSSWSGFDFAYYLDARTVTADRVLPNTFYLYYAGQGVFETTNGGSTWTKVFSGQISPYSNYNAVIESVPGEAGNLFFTGGSQSGFSSEGFYRSTNQGATWTAIPNVTEVICFGFGASAPGQSYPSIYIVGWVNKVYGVWQSVDDAQSWTQIGTYPTGSLDEIKTISGDPNVFGKVYIGFAGGGYAYLNAGSSVTLTTSPATVDFTSGGNTVNATAATLLAADSLTGAGSDTLALTGGGTINLNTPSVFTGFSTITVDNSNTALTLRNGETLSVILGSRIASVTGGSTAGRNAVVALGTGTDTVTFTIGSNTVQATAATLLAADHLTGAGSDTFALTGGGTINLNTPSVFTGFATITVDNYNTALTLKNGATLSVILGNGIDSVTGGSAAGSNAVVALGTGIDSVTFTTGNNTVDATRATLNSADSLTGAGSDTLALTGGGIFTSLGSLAHFSGFSTVTLDNSGSTVNVGNYSLTVNGTAGGNNAITLGSGTDSVKLGTGNDTVTLGTGTATVSFAGGSNTVNATAGTLLKADSLTGAGSDMLALAGGGTINLNTPSVFAGFAKITVDGNNTSLVLKNGATLSVTLGSGTDSVIGGSATGSNAVVALGTGADTVTFTIGSNTVKATATTLLTADSLTGAGSDKLALTGGGTINLNKPSMFTGFATITEDNSNTAITLKNGETQSVVLGNGTDTVIGGSTAGSNAVVTLGTGTDTVTLNSGSNTMKATATTLLAADSLTGAGSDTPALTGTSSTFNLTQLAHFSGFSEINLSGSGDTLSLTNNNLTVLRTSGSGDTIKLGTGIDTVLYTNVSESTASSPDTITGFNATQDKIDFSNISGLNSNVQPVNINYLTSTPTSIAGHTIDVVTIGGNTVIYANAAGSSESISSHQESFEINLTGVTAMTSSDFILHH